MVKALHKIILLATFLCSALFANGQETTQVGEAFNDCPAFVPTAFTPNGDTKNDYWGAQINPECTPETFNLRVFDRWGRLMYHAKSPSSEYWWDGTFEGTELRSGTYLWQLDAAYINPDGSKRIDIREKGIVVLVR